MTTSPLKAKAMILAAGRGERMRPLTDRIPKPMLVVRGKPLIQWHIEALARSGFTDIAINTAWLGDQINAALGNGESLHTRIGYSREGKDFGYALETAGGIIRALPLMDPVFWVVAGDVFAPDFSFSKNTFDQFIHSDKQAHLWLVPNPPHNPEGDFGLTFDGLALNLTKASHSPKWTYSTMGLYRASFFEIFQHEIPTGNPVGVKAALAPMLRAAMDQGMVSAEIFHGPWTDVGTPERLRELNL